VAGCWMVRCSRVLGPQVMVAAPGSVAMLRLALTIVQLSAWLADAPLMQMALLRGRRRVLPGLDTVQWHRQLLVQPR
jgi:hypothetical protein